eukprot:GHVP01022901.1.p1 GENE.GHVP01022901.1~~GHVP01022901.1.p1  ORF type:complete len:963 (-),score=194.07 GHVP01022901.1:1082-3970(-)
MTLPKDISSEMEKSYNPLEVEKGWAEWWEERKFFTPSESQKPEENPFVLMIPPPNVTGSLHLGHTLTVSIEDAVCRYHRMSGREVLWVPGVDHAGIATQSVVERRIYKEEGKTKHDYGREGFLKKIWEWKEVNGDKICYQLRRIGASVDWTREAFTMSPQLSNAVTEAFVRLFEKNLIYRETRLVSWSSIMHTALSDIEVEIEEISHPTHIKIKGFDKSVEVGVLWHFSYPVKGIKDRFLEVATTRIETMLGDTAVAVHPNDSRYKDLIGLQVEHPFFPERDIPVIADDYVDPEFGTGAVKITPAHDKNDYEIGRRHNLEFITIFTLDGKIHAETGGPFAGQHRFECRIKIQKELEKLGLLGEKKPNPQPMRLPRCSRSKDIIEYILIPQWWMTCDNMALRAKDAVANSKLRLIPEWHTQTWNRWLDNTRERDWCISRQLWWGHQIPAYRIVRDSTEEDEKSSDQWVVARTMSEALEKAKTITGNPNIQIIQDEDVLDTWFSSGLFPFSTLGWPNKTSDMKRFFPNTLLETGWDILFFWVARMVMMSLELLDEVPFNTVFLHAMVRDAHGKKMSKTLGNVIDPIEVIEGITLPEMHAKLLSGNLDEKEVKRATEVQKKDFPKGIPMCGADALRYCLLSYTRQGKDVNLDVLRVNGYKMFCNKLWNATKLALMYVTTKPDLSEFNVLSEGNRQKWDWVDRWIISRMNHCANKVNNAFTTYSLDEAVTATYTFWYEFCDVFLEFFKFRHQDPMAQEVLCYTMKQGLIMLHPMMPFITEELFQRLPAKQGSKRESICIEKFPVFDNSLHDAKCEQEFSTFKAVLDACRSLEKALEIKTKPVGFVQITKDNKFLKNFGQEIKAMAKFRDILFEEPTGPSIGQAVEKFQVWVGVDQLERLPDLVKGMEAKKKALDTKMAALVKRMESEAYEKTPDHVKELDSQRKSEMNFEIDFLVNLISSAQKNFE